MKLRRLMGIMVVTMVFSLVFGCRGVQAATCTVGDATYTYTILNDEMKTCRITAYNGSATALTVPDTLDEYTVTEIGSKAFKDSPITDITLPDSVTKIGGEAFMDSSITGITIPDSVTEIGGAAFQGSKITSIILPDSVTILAGNCFHNCTNLTSIKLPKTLVGLYSSCFSYCTSLTSITLPDSVTWLGNYCFAHCSQLKNVTISNSLTALSNSCFAGCTSLESIKIPNSVISLGDYCFTECKGLKSVTFSNLLTSLGTYCFQFCGSLKSIRLPDSVTSLGNYCFSLCTGLTSITLSNALTSLGDSCFWNCNQLTSIMLPESLKSLGKYCFSDCLLLTSVYFQGAAPSVGTSIFNNGASGLTIYYKASKSTVTGFTTWGYKAIAIDDIAPAVSGVTPTILKTGTKISAASDEAGTLYLVPKGTYATKSALQTVINAKTGAAAQTTENTPTIIDTKDLTEGTYQIYAVDDADSDDDPQRTVLGLGMAPNISLASADITVDNTPPALNTVKITSGNSDVSKAKTGDTITLSLKASERITTPTVSIAGKTATVIDAGDSDATTWQSTYTMTGTETEGTITFSASFSDLAGNAGTAVSTTTDFSNVIYDKTAPQILSYGIESGTYGIGQSWGLRLHYNEPIIVTTTDGTPYITLNFKNGGTAKAEYDSGSGKNELWFRYKVAVGEQSDGISVADVIALNGGTLTDAAGNSAQQTLNPSILNPIEAKIDGIVPTLTKVSIHSNNNDSSKAKTGDQIILDLTASEAIEKPTAFFDIGFEATVNDAGDTDAKTWQATYTLQGYEPNGKVDLEVSFKDLARNSGTAVSATTDNSSVTYDKRVPNLTNVKIISNNSDTDRAKTGDTITLSITASESISAPAITIAGNSATVIDAGDSDAATWQAMYTMTGTETEGTVAFNVSFSDLAGNAGAAVSTTTDGSSVTYDKSAPMLTTVKIASDNSDASRAKTGDTITLSLEASEIISTPVVTIAGNTANVTEVVNGDETTWQAKYTMAGMEIEGTVTINVSFSDLAGNAGAATNTTTDVSSVIYDKSTPTLTVVSINSDNSNPDKAKTGDTITLNLTASERIITPTVTIAGNAATVTDAGDSDAQTWRATYTMAGTENEGIVAFIVSFSDLAGNVGTAVSVTTDNSNVTYDKSAPALTTVKIASNNSNAIKAKIGDTITLSLTASESITTPTITVAGNVATVSGNGTMWAATYTMQSTDTEGIVAFKVSGFSDLTGNAGTVVSTTTDGSSVIYDKSGPTVVRFSPGDNSTETKLNAAFKLTFSEPVTAGAGKIYLYKKDGTLVEAIAATKASFSDRTVTIAPTNKLAVATGYYVRIEATAFQDAVGNAYAGIADSTGWSFTTVASPITITFKKPVSGAKLNINTGSTVIVKLADQGLGIDTSSITIQIDSGTAVKPFARVATSEGYTLYYVITNINYDTADYSHTIKVTAADSSGATSSGSVTFIMEPKRNGFGFGRLRFD